MCIHRKYKRVNIFPNFSFIFIRVCRLCSEIACLAYLVLMSTAGVGEQPAVMEHGHSVRSNEVIRHIVLFIPLHCSQSLDTT